MKKLILFSLLILFVGVTFAQHETDNWFFGWNAGINFSTGTAAAQYGSAMATTEGCSSISDAAGNVLFYTEGVSVWNKNNQVMPNGTGLFGSVSSTQSALVVPKPGSTTEFYIFTVDEIGGPNGFEYSLVDMTLDGGLGDVTVKNNFILGNVTEKLTAVQQENTGNYWIAVHEWGSDAFYVYLLTSSGLQAPVISHTGIVHNTSAIQNTYGQMKFNACGNMIGVAVAYQDTVEVFLFDNATGVVSNPFTLPIGFHVYGLDFSSNSSKLYISTYDPDGTLVQYNLDVLNIDSILASKTPLSVLEDTYGIQLGADGKIYVCRSFSQYLGVVNLPDLPGFACNYDNFGFDLDPSFNGVNCGLSVPGFVTSWLLKGGHCLLTNVSSSDAGIQSFSIYPNPAHNEFTITYSKGVTIENGQLEILDVAGRKLHESVLSKHFQLSTFNFQLNSGIYFVRIKDGDNNLPVQKLIID